MKPFENLSIEFPCPHCGKKMKKPLGSMKNNRRATCTWCHKAFTFETNRVGKNLGGLDANLAGVKSSAAKLSK